MEHYSSKRMVKSHLTLSYPHHGDSANPQTVHDGSSRILKTSELSMFQSVFEIHTTTYIEGE